MINYSGSSPLSQTTFFTAQITGAHVYSVFATLSASGTNGKNVSVLIRRNGQRIISSFGIEVGDQPDTEEFSAELTDGDTLSVQVTSESGVSWNLNLRLVRILDEL